MIYFEIWQFPAEHHLLTIDDSRAGFNPRAGERDGRLENTRGRADLWVMGIFGKNILCLEGKGCN